VAGCCRNGWPDTPECAIYAASTLYEIARQLDVPITYFFEWDGVGKSNIKGCILIIDSQYTRYAAFSKAAIHIFCSKYLPNGGCADKVTFFGSAAKVSFR